MSSIARAKRPFYAAKSIDKEGCIFFEGEVEFDWHRGMSWQVRQRSSLAMHKVIEDKYPHIKDMILEVSTKSTNYELGTSLSAMNLMFKDEKSGKTYPVENWFQASKEFVKIGQKYGPYTDLLKLDPVSARRYMNVNLNDKIEAQYSNDVLFNKIRREINMARLNNFIFLGKIFNTEPKSAFYDYLYSMALRQNDNLAKAIKKYRVFTDIEFSPIVGGKLVRYNTQARACAIFVALSERNLLDIALEDFDSFVDCVKYDIVDREMEDQMTLFNEQELI